LIGVFNHRIYGSRNAIERNRFLEFPILETVCALNLSRKRPRQVYHSVVSEPRFTTIARGLAATTQTHPEPGETPTRAAARALTAFLGDLASSRKSLRAPNPSNALPPSSVAASWKKKGKRGGNPSHVIDPDDPTLHVAHPSPARETYNDPPARTRVIKS